MAPSTPSVSSSNSTGNFVISINKGAQSTGSRNVSLTLDGGPDAKTMVVSEDMNFVNVGQIPYATSTIFTLSPGGGNKTVYAKFYTSWGQTSPVVSSTIALSSSVPVVSRNSTASQTPASTAIKPFTTRLIFGMKDEDVVNLQKILAQDKSVYPEGIISGYFGNLTLKAVEAFQEKYHIANPDIIGYGQVGPHTMAKLNQFLGLISAPASPDQNLSSSQVFVPVAQNQGSAVPAAQVILSLIHI